MPSVYIKTYGCQMNERDSEQVARDLVAHGYTIAPHEKEADVILLNTCSVREMAESKAIGKMGFLKKERRLKPQLVLGYLGCMAQRLGGALAEKTPHVDLIVGTQKFHRVADYVTEALRRREETVRAQERDEWTALTLSARPPILDVDTEEGSQNTIRDHLIFENRLLSKFADDDEVPGASGAQNRSVHDHTAGREAAGSNAEGSPKRASLAGASELLLEVPEAGKLRDGLLQAGPEGVRRAGASEPNASTRATQQFASAVEFRKQSQATAFISIMQGCNMHCTFCIVPTTRGPERSRPITEIVREAEQLVASGVREVTLLGQIVNLYGRHEMSRVDDKSPFVQLLEALHAVEGLERIRFTSPHPMGFRRDLIDCIGRLPKVMEHVHLPLQSGSDRILKAMHRPYTATSYRKLVHALRAARPDIAITTDIIVGFPGETEEEYLASRSLAEELAFDGAFIFRYSQRGDTPAATMERQLPEEIKEFRNKDLLTVINASAAEKLNACVGTLQEILCEGPSRNDPKRLAGRTRTNKIVIFEGGERFHREIFKIRITKASSSTLYGDPAITLS